MNTGHYAFKDKILKKVSYICPLSREIYLRNYRIVLLYKVVRFFLSVALNFDNNQLIELSFWGRIHIGPGMFLDFLYISLGIRMVLGYIFAIFDIAAV